MNELFFNTKSTRGVSFPVQTVQEFADGLMAAVTLGHICMDLFIDTGRLNFIAEPNPYNFNHFQLDTPFPTVRPPAAATGMTLDINALVAVLAAHTAALSSAPSTTAPAGGTLAPPAGSVPVTNIFNYTALPSDVHLRFDHHADTSKMVTRSAMDIEFASTIPNLN